MILIHYAKTYTVGWFYKLVYSTKLLNRPPIVPDLRGKYNEVYSVCIVTVTLDTSCNKPKEC